MSLSLSLILFLCFIGFICVLMLLGHLNQRADWGHWCTNIVDGLIRLYCHRFHRQKVEYITLPTNKKLLLAANHVSGIDPFLLICALKQPVRFMIAIEEYNKPILHWMFKAAGCIPVDRGGRVDGAFRSAIRAINQGELVALFPQGGIHCEKTPRRQIKAGIIKLCHLTQCDILPIRISGIKGNGDILQSVIQRSHAKLEAHSLISYKQTEEQNFRYLFSQWLLFEREQIL
jgi:1-acyl-sn-glycerol-3-phosphate acyltransferase